MSRRIQIPVGTRFGRLETISETYPKTVGTQVYGAVRCKCRCGKDESQDIERLVKHLRNGKTQSCGCLRAELAGKRSRERAAK